MLSASLLAGLRTRSLHSRRTSSCFRTSISTVHQMPLSHLLQPFTAAAATEPLHALSITSGSAAPISVHHALILAYAADGDLQTARQVFDRMPNRIAVSYNSIIAASSRRCLIDEAWALVPRMMLAGLRPTRFTFGSILSSPSSDPIHGTQIHPLILKIGLLHTDPFSATALLGLLARSGRLCDAFKLFEEMPEPTLVTWNSIISAFAQHGSAVDSIFLFRELMRIGIRLSECSFLSILSAFRSSESLQSVEQVHGLAIKTAIISNLMVANVLLSVYSACNGPYVSEKLFIMLPVKDVVSWNTLISAFAKSGLPERAIELFLVMSLEGYSPNATTFASILGACADFNVAEYGEFIHAKTIKNNHTTGILVGTSLIDFYSKGKSPTDANKIFDEMPEKNTASWNALISGYSEADCCDFLALVKEMLKSEFRPNEFSFSSGIKRAPASDLLQLHSLIIRMGYDSNEYVSSAVIASYGAHGLVSEALAYGRASVRTFPVVSTNIIAGLYNRGGRYEETLELLSQVQDPDVVSWNILLTACARNGEYARALELFKHMRTMGYLLDEYTAVSLLSICSKINSLDIGTLLHGLIIKTNAGCSDVFVNNLLLDMYAKCGGLEGCLRVFDGMDERNLITWTALISGLGLHGCAHEALERFRQMESEGFKPDRVAFLTVLSACRHGGLVKEGISLFESMNTYGVEPEMDHYTCVVDLLCRYGHLNEAELVISGMPFQPNALIWRTFLQGCKRYRSI